MQFEGRGGAPHNSRVASGAAAYARVVWRAAAPQRTDWNRADIECIETDQPQTGVCKRGYARKVTLKSLIGECLVQHLFDMTDNDKLLNG